MLITTLKAAAKRHVEHFDRFVDRRTLSHAEFVELLRELGLRPGAAVMIHSSLSQIRRRVPNTSAAELIQLFQDLVGPSGTIAMPTFPFSGRQAPYVEANDRFDVHRTPSKVGALTEVFRRMPGVMRSLHPTHPVAAWGRHARDLLATHHEGTTFGTTSPFYKLGEYDGMVVGLGTRMQNAFTIIHVAEELHPAARELAFDERPRQMIIADGVREIPYSFRVMRQGVTREYQSVESVMLGESILRYVRPKGLQCAATKASRFIERALQLADRNQYLLRV